MTATTVVIVPFRKRLRSVPQIAVAINWNKTRRFVVSKTLISLGVDINTFDCTEYLSGQGINIQDVLATNKFIDPQTGSATIVIVAYCKYKTSLSEDSHAWQSLNDFKIQSVRDNRALSVLRSLALRYR